MVQHKKITNRGEAMTAARRDDRLKGKVAIVTGAGSRAEGIGNGRATAVILARHGARVTLVDNVAQWADETKRLIGAEAGVSQIVEGDVVAPASGQAIVARTKNACRAWGGEKNRSMSSSRGSRASCLRLSRLSLHWP